MKVFLDANILVTVLNKEYPSYPWCARILSYTDSRFEFFTSPLCLAIAFYFAEKKKGATRAKADVQLLTEHLSVSEHSNEDVKQVLQNKKIHDFEDGLEYYSALGSGCTILVTGDVGDFYFSEIEVFKPKDFLVRHLV